jgi:two-component system sensor histidine kinase YesM
MKNRTRVKTIQSNLFFTYSMIIIIVLLIIVTSFYIWSSNLLKKQAFESINNLSYSMSGKLDNEIQSLDTVSLNICYSNLVKSRFASYLAVSGTENNTVGSESATDQVNNSKELIDMLTAIIGPSRPVQQVYLYNFTDQVFGTGFDNSQHTASVSEKSWFKQVMQNKGSRLLSLPEKDPNLSRFISSNNNIYYISLCRMYFNNYSEPQGIVEVKQYCDTIFNDINQYLNNNSDVQIFIYNDEGKIIYPFTSGNSKNGSYYFKYCNTKTGKNPIVTNPSTKEKELLSYTYSDNTGWTTAMVVNENNLFLPYKNFTVMVILATSFIMLIALLFSFKVAKRFTTPINLLRSNLRAIDLQNIPENEILSLNSGLSELEDLNLSFYKMNKKIKKSVDDLMLSQKHELNSKILALQSQMNPHFLYNTLATISAMAEENMNNEITLICENICDMLRYISSDSSRIVSMSTETAYTEKYLVCMQMRYGDKLNYTFSLDKNAADVLIPKLMIQPLVENSIKYSAKQKPPWNISIITAIENDCWTVSVCDRGPGFTPKSMESINRKIEEIKTSNIMPSLELEGMGLLNIFIRLKLLYAGKMRFEISNREGGGGIVTIGGSIIKTEGDE